MHAYLSSRSVSLSMLACMFGLFFSLNHGVRSFVRSFVCCHTVTGQGLFDGHDEDLMATMTEEQTMVRAGDEETRARRHCPEALSVARTSSLSSKVTTMRLQFFGQIDPYSALF